MRNKKVIAIISGFPYWLFTEHVNVQGGYQAWLSALHKALDGQDEFDIHWVCLSKHVQKALDFQSLGQTVHVIPRARLIIGLYTAYAYDRWHVARLLHRIGANLVHSWGTEECNGLCACDFRGLKLHSVQGLLKTYMQRGSMSKFERRNSFYEPKVLRSIPNITAESPWAADRTREIAPNAKPYLFEYAVEEHFFNLSHTPTPEPNCVHASSGVPVKNVGRLVKAFSSPALSHVHLYLAGIPQTAYPNATPNIHKLGRVSREETARLLSESWCLVHPSLADTGPTIAKEARVIGTPCILSTECGSKQHIHEGKSGYIIAPNDCDAMIDRVLRITASRQTSLEMGAYHREETRRALSAETMRENLLRIYRSIIATGKLPEQ